MYLLDCNPQVNNYHKQKQMTTDMSSHLYQSHPGANTVTPQSSMPAQNGNFQNLQGQ